MTVRAGCVRPHPRPCTGRARCAAAATLVLLPLVIAGSAAAQSSSPGETDAARAAIQIARSAMNEGRFDEVEAATRAFPADSQLVALRARAEIQRGRYAEAEQILRPTADGDPTSDAALELALLHRMLGHAEEAERALDAIASTTVSDDRSGDDDLRAARAAQALGRFEEANTRFRQAANVSPHNPEINTWWGDLFLEKYNEPDAARSYLAALRIDGRWVDAQVGLARTLSHENPPRARALAEQALAINPASVPAHLVLARLELDLGRRAEARASIGGALQINPDSLEANSLAAAMAFVEGRTSDFDAAVARVVRVNPSYGEIYRVVADQLAGSYRFDEAVAMAQRALALDPRNSRAAADLGLHLLRTGDEAAARRALDQSFRADSYDVVTYNLLTMLDSLDTFVTLTDGELVVRLSADEAPVLREQVPALAKRALAVLSERYGFVPTGPILVEVFPKHDDFAVRNVGLPGMIGALGACFGRVVTLDSPRARPPGMFDWRATLWHEMAHVITLQMSRQRVPRWLTEGLSVWEESRGDPDWVRDADVSFAQALEKGDVLPVAALNDGFSNPASISMAYEEASLLVDYLVSSRGEPALHRLLRAYGEGLDTDAAIRAVYALTLDQIQVGFTQYLDKRFGALRAALRGPAIPPEPTREVLADLARRYPGSFPVQMALGERLAAEKDDEGAIAAFERASALIPVAIGKDSPNALIADIALARGNRGRAAAALEALLQADHTALDAARTLTTLLDPATDAARAEKAWARVAALDPFDASAHTTLGTFALGRRDAAAAVQHFRMALATNPPDPVAAHFNLARASMLAGDRREAKRQALYTLEIAPSYEPAQVLLLELVEGA